MRFVLLLSWLLLLVLTPAHASCVWPAGQTELTLVDCTSAVQPPTGLPDQPARGRSELIRLQLDQAQSQVLSLGVPDVQRVALYHWQQGQWQLLFSQDPQQPFSSRLIASPRLAVPLQLSAGEHQFYLNYYIHANGRLQPVLFAPDAFARAQLWQQLQSGVLMGVMLTMLILVLVYRSFSEQEGYWAYGALVLGHVAMLPQIEGYYFQLLWPELPQLNPLLPPLLGVLVLAGHALFAMVFFRLPQRYPRINRCHRVVLLLLGLHLVLLLWRYSWPGAVYDPMPLLVGISIGYAGLAWLTAWRAYQDKLAGAGLYSLGTLGLAVCSMLLLGFSVLGFNPFPTVDFFLYPKIGFMLETVFFTAAVISRMLQFRQQQAEQRVRRLAEAAELAQAEQERRLAQALAADSALRLATASHDISQPLASLRFAIEVLKAQQAQQPLAEHIDRTIQYAQTLLQDVMQDCKNQHQAPEQVSLGALFATLLATFSPQAQQKGLQLRVVDTAICLDTSYLVLQRILQNLLANAIRYSHQGNILLGVRRRRQGLEIQLWDQGPGLLPEQLHNLQQAFVQGANASAGTGIGLGLYIVNSLCQQLGYQLRVHAVLRRGSCFSIWIPAVPVHE